MEPSRRLVAFLLALSLASFVAGLGVQASLALMTDQESNPSTITTASAFDTVAPTVVNSVVSKNSPYYPGFVGQGSPYFIYANVTDAGTPTSGVNTVTVNASSFDNGQTAVALVAGSYSIGGVSYNYRSTQHSTTGTLAAGSYTYPIVAIDIAGNSATQSGFSVTVDNTKPSAVDVQTTNAGVAGQPGIGDTITYTYSEIIDPDSVLAGWTGASTNVVLRVAQNAAGDKVSIRNAGNSAQLPFGTVNLVGLNYVTATRDFGASGTPSTMVAVGNTFVITLGTASGAVGTESVANYMDWSPVAGAHDQADNSCAVIDAIESDTLDLDF